jgi:hypothetical protein
VHRDQNQNRPGAIPEFGKAWSGKHRQGLRLYNPRCIHPLPLEVLAQLFLPVEQVAQPQPSSSR